jgi:release factor glutamine methyltransferase
MLRVDEALAWARTTLAGAFDSEPIDAALLLMVVMGVERAALLAHPERTLTPDQETRYRDFIQQQVAGVPVPYLTGTRAFYDRDFEVTPDVLIPRPETEHLIEAALNWAATWRALRVVDVGTGSGAIAVTLAVHLPESRVWAVDISRAALRVARRNAVRYHCSIGFIQGDLLSAIAQADLIAANLPYIATAEMHTLAVARSEPHLALDGGPDGLDLIRRLLAQVPRILVSGGLLLMEIGAGQGERVRALSESALPDARVDVIFDYAGLDRIVVVERG